MGEIDLKLSELFPAARHAKKCKLPGDESAHTADEEEPPLLNIFETKKVRGWYACGRANKSGGGYEMTGKVEVELELLTSDEVLALHAETLCSPHHHCYTLC